MRYDLAFFKTRARAEAALEHMFAAGEVSEGEAPEVEDRSGRTRAGAPVTRRFVITARGA